MLAALVSGRTCLWRFVGLDPESLTLKWIRRQGNALHGGVSVNHGPIDSLAGDPDLTQCVEQMGRISLRFDAAAQRRNDDRAVRGAVRAHVLSNQRAQRPAGANLNQDAARLPQQLAGRVGKADACSAGARPSSRGRSPGRQ